MHAVNTKTHYFWTGNTLKTLRKRTFVHLISYEGATIWQLSGSLATLPIF